MKSLKTGDIITDMLILSIEIKKFKDVLIRAELADFGQLNNEEKVFITNSVYEIIDKLIFIDYIIKQLDECKEIEENPYILNLIRQAVFFIYFDKGIEHQTIVDNTGNIVKKKYKGKLSKQIKGIVKKIIVLVNEFELPSLSDEIEYLSIVYSYPVWIIKYWFNVYGFDTVLKICHISLNKAKLNFAINDCLLEEEIIYNEIAKEVGEVIKDTDSSIYCTPTINNYNSLTTFKKGMFYSINKAKAIGIDYLKLKENSSVLNMVARNGSLSFYCLKKMRYSGQVISLDNNIENIRTIANNKQRLQIKRVTEKLEDCQIFNESFVKKFDYIILDVPCSELGEIKRNPISKYRYNFSDIPDLANVQRRMLKNASKYLKEDGKILYLSKTISRKENVENINWFVENFNFVIKEMHEIMPFDYDNVDSAFISILERKKRRNNG